MAFGKTERTCAAGAVLGLVLAAPGAAPAQAYIGAMVGQMVAQQQAAAAEAACRKGVPASPKVTAAVKAHMDEVMDAYFALPATADEKALGKVFALKADDVRWRDASGATPIAQLGPHLGGTAPQRTLVASVVGGDGESGRALWTAPAAAPGGEAMSYAVDVVHQHGWRIRRMAVLPASKAPDAPAAYCHYDPTQGY